MGLRSVLPHSGHFGWCIDWIMPPERLTGKAHMDVAELAIVHVVPSSWGSNIRLTELGVNCFRPLAHLHKSADSDFSRPPTCRYSIQLEDNSVREHTAEVGGSVQVAGVSCISLPSGPDSDHRPR
jgi:hypothetical protein